MALEDLRRTRRHPELLKEAEEKMGLPPPTGAEGAPADLLGQTALGRQSAAAGLICKRHEIMCRYIRRAILVQAMGKTGAADRAIESTRMNRIRVERARLQSSHLT